MMIKVAMTGLSAGLLIATVLSTLFGEWWVGALIANFRVHLLLLGILIALASLLTTSGVLVAAAVLAIVVNGAALAMAAGSLTRPTGPPPSDAKTPGVRVMTFNLLFSNRDLEALRRCIAHAQPDLLLLQEAGRYWRAALGTLEDRYPYRLDLNQTGRFDEDHGVMLFSRHPILHARQHPLAGMPDRLGAALVDVAGHPLWAASVHIMKPTGRWRQRLQQQQLRTLAAWISTLEAPVVVGGDFNATLYMPQMQRFVGTAGLGPDHQARPWRGILAGTFPASLSLLGLKIDHVMVRDLVIRRASTLHCAGSDHLPVVVDLAHPPRPTQAGKDRSQSLG